MGSKAKATAKPAEKAYAYLLKQIITGKIEAGSKLGEEKISEQLKISRTPVREALARLVQDGLVEKVRCYGCCVRELNDGEVRELFECQKILETAALRLGAANIPPDALDAIIKLIDYSDEEDSDTRASSIEADRQLHELIISSCPNNQLRELARKIQERTYPYRNLRAYNTGDSRSINSERREIVKAIKESDAEKACTLLGDHIMRGIDYI
ncbi:MAG: GntR family transcriptional regulator [Planctomycetes bacterium]|nr:GntR family transcriptional regulator [Planctomycetota bacterium]